MAQQLLFWGVFTKPISYFELSVVSGFADLVVRYSIARPNMISWI